MRREGEVCPQAAGEGAELSSEQDSNPAALGQAFHVAQSPPCCQWASGLAAAPSPTCHLCGFHWPVPCNCKPAGEADSLVWGAACSLRICLGKEASFLITLSSRETCAEMKCSAQTHYSKFLSDYTRKRWTSVVVEKIVISIFVLK